VLVAAADRKKAFPGAPEIQVGFTDTNILPHG
jgi:hypothetical protein